MLTYPYAVKYNGVIYPANTAIEEVEEQATSENEEEEKPVSENEEEKEPKKKAPKGGK